MAREKVAPPAAAMPVAAPPKKSKLLLIIIAVVVLAAAGGGGWYFFSRHESAPKVAEVKPPVFVALEPFTVNLLSDGSDHYLQIGITYQLKDDKITELVKQQMPDIRHRILLLLSSKRPNDLASLEGKQKLITELVATARESVPGSTPERGVDGALLSSFVIQ